MKNLGVMVAALMLPVGVVSAETAFRASDAIVVINDATAKSKQGRDWYGAALDDLTNVLTKVTGHQPAVYREGKEPKGAKAVIYFGETAAARAAGISGEGLRNGDWRVKVVPGKAFVYGKTGMGASYAMTEFAERFCGYDFCMPDGMDPHGFDPALEIPVADIAVKPVVYYRRVYTARHDGRLYPKTKPGWMNWVRRLRIEATDEIEGEFRAAPNVGDWCHSIFRYLPPEKHFKEHPDWYSMGPDGKRHAIPNAGSQICYTSPEAFERIYASLVAFVEEARAKWPVNTPMIFDMTQMDNCAHLCLCPDCRKVIAKYNRVKGGHAEGGDAGLQLEFANRMARRIRVKHPEVQLRFFAYNSTQEVPRPGLIVPEPNVKIWWCDLYGFSDHTLPLETSGHFNRHQADEIGAWFDLTKNVQVWDYMLDKAAYPECAVDAIAADARFFSAKGLPYLYMEMQNKYELPFYELNSKLMGELWCDPTLDPEDLVRRFCRVYGRGAEGMEKAIAFLRKVEREGSALNPSDWHKRLVPWVTRANLERFAALCRTAHDAEDDPTIRARMASPLLVTWRRLIKLLRQDPAAGEAFAAAQGEYRAVAREWASFGYIEPDTREARLRKVDDDLGLLTMRFDDLPAELREVPANDLLCLDYHVGNPWSREPDALSPRGFVADRSKPTVDYSEPYPIECGLYDGISKQVSKFRISAEMLPPGQGYRWVKLGRVYLARRSEFYFHKSWCCYMPLDDYHIYADGLPVDPNWYELYVSMRTSGPAFVPGATEPNCIRLDRMALRRVAPPKEPFRVADSAVVYADAYRETKVEPWGRMAAADLARILSLVTDSEVKAYSESEAPLGAERVIHVGPVKAAAGLEVGKPGVFAFRVKVEPKRVFLLGRNETGTSYAVTEFLERFCGYRFLAQDGENPYAVNPSLALAPADLSLAPAIPYRRVYRGWIRSWVQGNDLPKTAANWKNFARQRRLEMRAADCEPSHRVREVNHSTCHLAFTFLPPDKYAKAHPEWYSMDENGSRNSIPNGGGQLCYSNRAMRDEYAKNLLAMIEADRAADPAGAPGVYDITQLDNTSRLCLCPECKKTIAKYDRKPGGHRDGGDAGLQLEFANDIAARVAAKHPDVKVRIFAYVSTEAVPEGIDVHPNVVIWWCDVYSWSDHMRGLRHPSNARNCAEISGWLGKTRNFHLWDYMLYGTVPEVNAEAIRDDARLFRDLGVDDLFMESEYHDQPFYDLHQYLFDKLYFNPDDDLDRLIAEYCAVYGKGAAKMRELIGLLMKWERENVPESMEKWHQRELTWYTVENFSRMRELAEAAYALEDGAVPRSRIAYVLAGIDKWLMEKFASIYGKDAETARLRADYARYSKEWACRESDDPAKRKAVAKKLDDALLIDTLQFGQLPAELKGVSATDLKCIDWRSKKMGSGLKLVDDPASESGKSYRYVVAKMPDFPVSGGVYDAKTKKVLAKCQVERPANLKEGEFFWTKLCPVTLGWNSYLWLTGSWKMQAEFKSFYVNCDGAAVDVNRYEVWVSLRFTGPKYFPGSKAEDAIHMDRVVLRKIGR